MLVKVYIFVSFILMIMFFQNCSEFESQSSINSFIEQASNTDVDKVNDPSADLAQPEPVQDPKAISQELADPDHVMAPAPVTPDANEFEIEPRTYGNAQTFSKEGDNFRNQDDLSTNEDLVDKRFNIKTTKVQNGIRHHYSKRQAFNADESLINLRGKIYSSSDYKLISSSQSGLNGIERNWSNTDPNIIYGISSSRTSFVQYNLKTNKATTLVEFSGYSNCLLGAGEGNMSVDDKYVFVDCEKGGDKYGLSVDLISKKIIATIQLDKAYNWGSFSQSGKYIIIQGFELSNRAYLYDRSLNRIRKITDKLYHGDFGYNSSGEEVYVAISWDYIHYFRLSDNQLVFTAKGVGHGHLSCRNIKRPGWCYYSSNNGQVGSVNISRGSSDQKIKGSPPGQDGYIGLNIIEHMGFHRSTGNDYNAQAKVSASPTGLKVIYNSNWYGKSGVSAYITEFIQD